MILLVSLFVAAAGTGAFLRYVAHLSMPAPWGTFLVNIVGSLVMGFLFVALEKASPPVRNVLLVAFLGSLTTYSSFALDCVRFIHQSQWKMLVMYLILTNGLCILGCAAGWQIAKRLVIKF